MTEQLSGYRESHWKLPPESLRRREEVQRRVRNKLGLHTWKQIVRSHAEGEADRRGIDLPMDATKALLAGW